MKSLFYSAAVVAVGVGLLAATASTADAQRRGRYVGPPGSAYRAYTAPGRTYHRGPVVRHRGYSGRNVAAGAAAAIIGGVIINEIARSNSRTYYVDEGPGLSCHQLERRCDAGQDWACRRLDRDPNC